MARKSESAGNAEVSLEDFTGYFPFAPTALTIKECVRLAAIRKWECPSPILDVGCGDGLFAKLAFSGADVWGIDVNADEGRLAQATHAYSQIVLADIARAQIPERFFATCLANCSMEHVPDIMGGLRTILRGLRPGGRAFFFLPNRDWTRQMLSVRFLHSIGSTKAARALQRAIDDVFEHRHLHDEQGWRALIAKAGFDVVAVEPVGSTATTVAFEMFLLPSLAGWLNKRWTTRWTNFPRARRMVVGPVFRITQGALRAAGDSERTAEFLVVGQRPIE
jgi:SAM-dependent methyltransferase